MVGFNRHHKLLLADSDQDFLAMLKQMLEDNGFEVAAVSDGREAIKMALSLDFEIIIADMSLAAVKGFDFIHALNNLKPNAGTPVILTGVLNDADYLGIASTLHVSEYLPRPFDMSVLLGKIDLLLEQDSSCSF